MTGVTDDPDDPRLTHGPDPADAPYKEQAEVYLVLSEEERAKGFVRPLRRAYWHEKCGRITTMGREPFVISLKSGKQATHVEWQADRRMVDYCPSPGDRIFVDLTPERARVLAEQNVDRYLADPALAGGLIAQFGSREEAAAELAASYLEQPGAPDLIEVGAG